MAATGELTKVTAPEPLNSHGFGMMLVAPLSDENVERVSGFTSEIERRLGTTLWTPHKDITLGRVLRIGFGGLRSHCEDRFTNVLPAAKEVIAGIANATAPFTIEFDEFSASAFALIARSTQGSRQVAHLRAKFLARMAEVKESEPSVKSLDFVHTTIGRYLTTDLLVDDVNRVTQEVVTGNSNFPFTQTVDKLILAEEPRTYELIPRAEVALTVESA